MWLTNLNDTAWATRRLWNHLLLRAGLAVRVVAAADRHMMPAVVAMMADALSTRRRRRVPVARAKANTMEEWWLM